MSRMNNQQTLYTALITAVLLCCLLFTGCNKADSAQSNLGVSKDSVAKKPPALRGRLVFHSYSCYGCKDSKLYLFDFTSGALTQLNAGWAIDNCMNAHFSPDGKKIVFMGEPAGTANWDVFIWEPGSTSQPADLTAALGSSRDEDPKFAHSGNRIVFKRNGHLSEMDLTGTITRDITTGTGEQSMPYYSYNDSLVLYAEGSGAASDIYMVNADGANTRAVEALPGVQEYYPIANDSLSFYYTAWSSAANLNDQLYRGYYDTREAPAYLPFNDLSANYSDPYPCGTGYVFLSSTRSGSRGGYDLYIADINTGDIWSLSSYNAGINSVNDELGSCYSPY